MVGIIDPPRKTVKDSVKKCRKAGIRPIMITGDSLITACAIAKEVGIIEDDTEGTMGAELDKYTDEEMLLANKFEKTGYTFIGWLLNGKTYDFNTKITKRGLTHSAKIRV